jgi:murein L,D-transpeptidase YcbB/YkuD
MFPNDHAVYLHDTPNRKLFGTDRRAFSHGCVRVDQPFRLAEALLPADWTEQRLRRMVGGGSERTVQLPERIPIHLQYFTASVDEQGKMRLRDDIYGHSRKVQAALGY